GGAGPLHACELAAALRIPRVLIPATPGVLSALGMLLADTLKDYVRTIMVPAEESQQLVNSTLAELEEIGRRDLAREGILAEQIVIEPSLDLRYVGQSYELNIPFEGDMLDASAAFHRAHERRFGYSDPNERIQVVNVRLKARGLNTYPALERQEVVANVSPTPAMMRRVVFASEERLTRQNIPIYERATLRPGASFSGPAIVTQYDTTTLIPPEWYARVDGVGNLIIERVEEQNNNEEHVRGESD
ncbi:MAG TPA: hydantoinase/oxoprolinase family protein, partial [Ktedonosporobacter sp.]|nr:hydantoinase/oxoprolinase family protein [Ktedonosporobacter sp.]